VLIESKSRIRPVVKRFRPLKSARGGLSAPLGRLRSRFDSKFVVHGVAELLFATQVTLRGLDGDVAQQELNLVEFAASQMTEPGARPPQVVRCQLFYVGDLGGFSHDLPKHFRRHAGSPNLAGLVDRPK
jgi:hypothetical protein